MAGRIKGITIEFDGKTTKLEQAIKRVKNSTNDVDKQLKQVNKSLKMDPSNVTLLEQKQKLLKDRVEETRKKLTDLKNAQSQLDASGVDKNSKEYQELQREIIKAEKELKDFEKESRKLSNIKLTAMGEQFKQIGGKMQSAGKVMTQYVTAPLAGVGVAAAKATMDFDTGMSQVAATMGKTNDEISNLREFAIEMGSSTAFSATQAAEGLNYMALAGYSAEEAMEMLPTVLNLAAAGSMELGAASDMVTDAQTALGLSMGQTTTMVDQMAKTASTTNTSVAQLGEAMLQIGPTAKGMSGGTRELNQVLGLLADNGIKGAEAGTHLRNILLSMNTERVKKAFGELGVEIYDAEGNMRDLSQVFPEMAAAMDGLTSEERTAMLSKLFNKTDLASLNSLLDTNKSRWQEVGTAISDSGGAAQQMADTQLDNMQGSLTLLKSALEGAGIALGDTLAPAIRAVADFITSLVEKFNNLSPTAQRIITIVGLLVAGIGPLLLIGGTIITLIGNMMTFIPMIAGAIGGLSASLLPIIGIAAGVVAAGILIYKNWDKIKAVAVSLWEKIKTVFTGIKTTIINVWTEVKAKVTTVVEAIKTVISTVFNAVKNVVTKIWNGIKLAISVPITGAKVIVSTAIKAIKAVFNGLSTIVGKAKAAFNKIKEAMTHPIQTAKDTITKIIEKIKGIFPLNIGKIFSNFKLPHLSVEGGQAPFGIGGKGKLPHFNVEWYKTGGIFDDPTLIGVGEAGREILTPDKLLDEKLAASKAKTEALLAEMVAQNRMILEELKKERALKVEKRVAARIVKELAAT